MKWTHPNCPPLWESKQNITNTHICYDVVGLDYRYNKSRQPPNYYEYSRSTPWRPSYGNLWRNPSFVQSPHHSPFCKIARSFLAALCLSSACLSVSCLPVWNTRWLWLNSAIYKTHIIVPLVIKTTTILSKAIMIFDLYWPLWDYFKVTKSKIICISWVVTYRWPAAIGMAAFHYIMIDLFKKGRINYV